MKYKILLVGDYKAIQDGFFNQMGQSFECLTSTYYFDDIWGHVKLFEPDLVLYCLKEDSLRDEMMRTTAVKNKAKRLSTSYAIIGEPDICAEFQRVSEVAELVLVRPIGNSMIKEQLMEFLLEKERQKKEAERKLEEEKKRMEQIMNERLENSEKKDEKEEEKPEYVERYVPKKKDDRLRHILVIDDDPLMLRTIKRHLDDLYEVATAINGSIAYKFLEKKSTDLILLDYEMPGEKGPEVLERFRANDNLKDIPVVFITGVDDISKVQKALGMKPQGYLLKPIDRIKLRQTIREIIGT